MGEMTREEAHVAQDSEIQASQELATNDAAHDSSASGLRLPSALSALPSRVKGSSLRRPSKIPRLAKQQSSVSSVTLGDSFSAKMTTHSSAVSVASAVSSRETTPFGSPTRPSSRLREPKQVVGRKRSRDETASVTTSVTIASVAERLRAHQAHSDDLSTATTQDDTASQVSVCQDDESEGVMVETQSSAVEEDERSLERQVTVARALQRDLLRDRARLRLKISAMKEDVETYYEVLARMEQVTVAVMARHSEGKNEESASVFQLAERIQSIISARKAEEEPVVETKGHTDIEQEGAAGLETSPRIAHAHNEEVQEY